MSIGIHLNGQEISIAEDETVLGLLPRLGLADDERGVAVAVDAEVVPRSQWASYRLPEGCSVEILRAVQGG